MNYVPDSIKTIIAVVCGNDWYWKGPVNDNICTAAEAFAEALNKKCKNAFAIVGGSAKVWRYDKKMPDREQKKN